MALINFPLLIPTKFVSRLTSTKQPVRTHVSQCRPAMSTTEAAKLIEQIPMRTNKVHEQTTIRRSGNYQPSFWEFNDIQSLNNPYAGEIYVKRSDELKEIVKEMLEEDQKEPLDLLELIDDLQRIGLSYHFEIQIKQALISIYNQYNSILQLKEDNLHAKALIFRLFRQHGFNVSQEIFDSFKDEKGVLKTSLCEDTKGMLYLYEASYLSVEGENTLELAREFTAKHLKKGLDDQKIDDHNLAALVQHALELPLHWKMTRVEARWFIDIYEGRVDMNPHVLELAKLDFNIVQAQYQEDLKYVTQWWKNTGIVEKLTFARDCVVPSFFWNIGMISEPQYGYARRMSTKVFALITTIDDTYDVYGTMDELELFTDAVDRWDINAMEQLPYYMKVCFLALYNSVNEMGHDALREHEIYAIPYLKKMWADLCKAYLVEAKWYLTGYKPTLEEYKSNAVMSIGIPVILLHAYLLVDNPIKREAMQAIYNYHDIVRCSSMILRLADDLGTCSDEMERGDVPKSVQCYMIETDASEEQAREYVKLLISETWRKMMKDRLANSLFSETFIKMAMDLDRAAHCVYEFGDGHGNINSTTRDRISSLLFEPIPVGYM